MHAHVKRLPRGNARERDAERQTGVRRGQLVERAKLLKYAVACAEQRMMKRAAERAGQNNEVANDSQS